MTKGIVLVSSAGREGEVNVHENPSHILFLDVQLALEAEMERTATTAANRCDRASVLDNLETVLARRGFRKTSFTFSVVEDLLLSAYDSVWVSVANKNVCPKISKCDMKTASISFQRYFQDIKNR